MLGLPVSRLTVRPGWSRAERSRYDAARARAIARKEINLRQGNQAKQNVTKEAPAHREPAPSAASTLARDLRDSQKLIHPHTISYHYAIELVLGRTP